MYHSFQKQKTKQKKGSKTVYKIESKNFGIFCDILSSETAN